MESVGLKGGSIFSSAIRPRRRCSSARDSALGRALSLILEERRTMAGAGCWISCGRGLRRGGQMGRMPGVLCWVDVIVRYSLLTLARRDGSGRGSR